MASDELIDLSKIPVPDILATLSYDDIFNELLGRFQTEYPAYELNQHDVVVKALGIGAQFWLDKRAEVNQDARQTYLALATGANLDARAANLLVTRLDGETDDEFRARAVLAPEGFSVAGPREAYRYHAMSAHPDIAHVGVTSPNPCEIQIVVLAKSGIPSDEVISAVTAALNDEDIRPIGDEVTIHKVQLVNYEVDAVIYTNSGPDADSVIEYAHTRVNEFIAAARKVSKDIPMSGIYANLHVPGVQKVILNSPTADLAISDLECGNCISVNIVFGGTDG